MIQNNRVKGSKPTARKKSGIRPVGEQYVSKWQSHGPTHREDCWGGCYPNDDATASGYCRNYDPDCEYDQHNTLRYCTNFDTPGECNSCGGSSSCGDSATWGCTWGTISPDQCRINQCQDYCELWSGGSDGADNDSHRVFRTVGCTDDCGCHPYEETYCDEEVGPWSTCTCSPITGRCWCTPSSDPDNPGYTGPMEEQAGGSGDMGNI